MGLADTETAEIAARTSDVEPTTMKTFLNCLMRQNNSGQGLAAAGVAHVGGDILYTVSCGVRFFLINS